MDIIVKRVFLTEDDTDIKIVELGLPLGDVKCYEQDSTTVFNSVKGPKIIVSTYSGDTYFIIMSMKDFKKHREEFLKRIESTHLFKVN